MRSTEEAPEAARGKRTPGTEINRVFREDVIFIENHVDISVYMKGWRR
ncbi:hypothetical protein LC085_19810 [Bacillus tianshenii]|nr:hypothetical protein [Bacillus tianshenii]MCA1322134.1 hypothetical protein [Bacillus tianshenii]